MYVIHLVTEKFPPSHGGMEASAARLTAILRSLGYLVIVHVRESPPACGDEIQADLPQVRVFGDSKVPWEEPLVASGWPPGLLNAERWRLDSLALCNTIAAAMSDAGSAKHCLVSVFLTREGFLGSHVADTLGIPHVAYVVGTDFSRGMCNPLERAAISAVISRAAHVVTKSGEQASGLRRAFGIENIHVVHNSADLRLPPSAPRSRPASTVTLFSDGGYSHKKGTAVLLRSFAELHRKGTPVRLVVCGDMYEGQEAYWSGLRSQYRGEFAGAVELHDHVSADRVSEYLQESDLYVSASLGEGCSPGRIAALCAGLALVTTRCGEMCDVAQGASHVRLAPPGDHESFTRELSRACKDLLAGTLVIDSERVHEWREHFSYSRERAETGAVFRAVLGAPG